MVFGLGKTDTNKLKEKRNWKKLGKLLSNKDSKIKNDSAIALIESINNRNYSDADRTELEKTLIENKQNLGLWIHSDDENLRKTGTELLIEMIEFLDYNDRIDISSLFQNNNHDDVIQYLMNEVHRNASQSSTVHPWIDTLLTSVINAGGEEELIKFHKDNEPKLSSHNSISHILVSYGLFKNWSIKEWIEIIPYANLSSSEEVVELEDRLDASKPFSVSQEEYDHIKNLIDSLPGGLNNNEYPNIANDVVNGIGTPTGERLLRKLEIK